MTNLAEAQAAIMDLHARYSDAVWRKDLDAFGQCFARDAQWRIGGMILEGRETIVSAFENIATHFNRILLTFRPPILDLGGEYVSARTYVDERTARKDGGPSTAFGLYFERFVDEGDRWRFKWRLWQTLYRGSADLEGLYFDNQDFGSPPGMPDWDTPPPEISNFPGQ